jgi:hypothetical protein
MNAILTPADIDRLWNARYQHFRFGGRYLAFPMSADVGGGQSGDYRSGRHPKHRNSVSNFTSVYYRTRDTSTFGLAAVILRFPCQTMSADVVLEFIGLADIENIEIAFRISFLSTIERDIQLSTSGLLAAILCFRFTSKSNDVGGSRTRVHQFG